MMTVDGILRKLMAILRAIILAFAVGVSHEEETCRFVIEGPARGQVLVLS
jgi:hypothetical protein